MPCIIAWNEAAASSSEMFLAIEKPSHHSVAAGIVPPPTVGAAASTVFLAISGAGPSGSISAEAREPQPLMIAICPDSHSGLIELVS